MMDFNLDNVFKFCIFIYCVIFIFKIRNLDYVDFEGLKIRDYFFLLFYKYFNLLFLF